MLGEEGYNYVVDSSRKITSDTKMPCLKRCSEQVGKSYNIQIKILISNFAYIRSIKSSCPSVFIHKQRLSFSGKVFVNWQTNS